MCIKVKKDTELRKPWSITTISVHPPIGGKSQKCFWEPDYWLKKILRKSVYSQAKNLIKEAIPLRDVEITLKCV